MEPKSPSEVWKEEMDKIAAGACTCLRCTQDRVAANPMEDKGWTFDPRMNKMFLCRTCGNKRCPHAYDHNSACTNSNEPGQKGSFYE